MTNTLRLPLRNISPDTISDLQEKYPNASVQIKLSEKPVRGGLEEAGFWRLIDLLDWSKEGDDDAVIESVVAALSKLPARHIFDFKDFVSQKLYLLDSKTFARHIGEGAWDEAGQNFHPDSFLFARCCAVANGRETFERIRQNPDLMPRDMEFSALLRIAGEAYRRQKGSNLRYMAAYPIETFSNQRGWEHLS